MKVEGFDLAEVGLRLLGGSGLELVSAQGWWVGFWLRSGSVESRANECLVLGLAGVKGSGLVAV